MEKTICEMFAGVGGFRRGFEALQTGWQTTWFNQWEPGAKHQWAHDCYVAHWGDIDEFTSVDIAQVDKRNIPDHNLLVGGFPCQDYSVAHPLSSSAGLEGKKGVLWWQIRDTLIAKAAPFCLFENVDRLLKSPASQRGRDFGVILACLNELGYTVEWRVINAADYGAVQRRRRTFIFAYRDDTEYAKSVADKPPLDIVNKDGFFATGFAIAPAEKIIEISMPSDIVEVSDTFKFDFCNAGFMRNGTVYTAKVQEITEQPILLGSILESNVDERYFISNGKQEKWEYLKGAKKILRISANGHEYVYHEGAIAFPDPWDKPGRTMLTSEATLNRSTHVVSDPGRVG